MLRYEASPGDSSSRQYDTRIVMQQVRSISLGNMYPGDSSSRRNDTAKVMQQVRSISGGFFLTSG